MPVQALSLGLNLTLTQNVVYALSGAESYVTAGALLQRADLYAGPFYDWAGSTGPLYNRSGGFVRCITGDTWFKGIRVKMKERPTPSTFVSYMQTIIEDRPSYYWRLDETSGTTAVDSVGGAHGTISGGVTLGQSGAVGKGMLFDGVDDKIVTVGPTIITIPPIFTFEAWIKTTSATDQTIFSTRGLSTGEFIVVYIDSLGRPSIYAIGSLGSGISRKDGQWHHIVFIVNSTSYKLYTDGQFETESISTVKTASSIGQASIGWDASFNQWFSGTIDEVAIYPYALSAAQISAHYTAKSVPPNSYASLIMGDNPSNYWQLDEEAGLVATDIKGGKNGTISGGTLLNQTGAINKSMQFNGTSGQIIVSPRSISTPFSLEFWIKTTDVGGHNPIVSFGIGAGGEDTLFFRVVNANLALDARPQGNGVFINSTFLIIDNSWHHVVWQILSGSLFAKLYIDGVEQILTGQLPIPIVRTPNRQIEIGWVSAWPLYYTGSLDEVAIYPYALTPTQIRNHYLFKVAPPNSYADVIMKSGPTNYWQLDEEGGLVANDLVGGAHGTISGGVTLNQAGIGKSMLFDGIDDKIVTAGNISVSKITTFEVWFKVLNVSAHCPFISVRSAIPNSFTVGLQYDGRPLVLGHDGTQFWGTREIDDGQWHHIAYILNGFTCVIYIDGVFDSSVSYIRDALAGQPVGIGVDLAVNLWGKGNIDEVAIYNRALSASEILAHYNARPVDPYEKLVKSHNPSNYWRLNETTGLVAKDIVGGKDGTISGGVTLNQAGIDKSMLFDGNTGKIQTTVNVNLVTPLTIEMWITTAIAGDRAFISNTTVGGGRDLIYVGVQSNKLRAYVEHASGGLSNLNSIKTISDNQWHHCVAIFGTTLTVYVDGILDSIGALTKPIVGVTGSTLDIGNNTGYSHYHIGNIDEVAIYPHALSSYDIQSHYLMKFGITNPSSYAAKVLLSGPSNYWRLNELSGTTATDIVGGLNGTLNGGVTPSGESGMTFNGTTGYIMVPDNASLNFVDAFTLEVWVKAVPNAEVDGRIIAKRTGTVGYEIFIYSTTGDIDTFIGTASASMSASVSGFNILNAWHNVTMTRSGSVLKIYIDGILRLERVDAPVGIVSTVEPLLLGRFCDSPIRFLNGNIDDLAIYPRALTPAEILEHYNARNS